MAIRVLRKNIRNQVKRIRVYRDELSAMAVLFENVERELKKEQIRAAKKDN